MYDKQLEKQRILGLMAESAEDEINFQKSENFRRAVGFALDEIVELEQEYNKFIASVSHLEIYTEVIKNPVTQDMQKMLDNLRYLVTKNYTKEEKASMPHEVMVQVHQTQERRIDLLKRIGRKYFRRNK